MFSSDSVRPFTTLAPRLFSTELPFFPVYTFKADTSVHSVSPHPHLYPSLHRLLGHILLEAQGAALEGVHCFIDADGLAGCMHGCSCLNALVWMGVSAVDHVMLLEL